MLEDHERRTLAAMEEMLASQDMWLDARGRRRIWWHRRWPLMVLIAGLSVVVGLLVLGLVTHALLIAVVTVVPMIWRLRMHPGRGPDDKSHRRGE